ncbi:gamma carbonic anhydrase family protein [Porphyromonas sp.]|uniref:gamma carbonic anhydrase family protein n=1 Tax=Porphyromonas sp. TaxID=1924944 RepID=UPI0026DA8DBE|nr:gamma carbonic anhydrase family protein [Porphyromonas sp.]MDO4770734.1 gamma carbonic anhydrase family protein [Porphyromonas sp.]
MAIIQTVRGLTPDIHPSCFLAANAVVVGDVVMGEGSSVWFSAVVRGDVNSIRIGKNVNIQDGAVIHTLYQKSVSILEDNVSIGHNAIIHGAKVETGALIGMGAIIMDNAVVGAGAIIAAGSVVLAGTEIPAGALYAGVPAKFVKMVDPEQAQTMNKRIAENYQMYASWFPPQD